MSKAIFISVDFERLGFSYNLNGPNGVGLVVFDADGNELESYESGIKITGGRRPDPDTMKEFWAKNQDAMKYLQAMEKHPKEVVAAIKALYFKYKDQGHRVHWVGRPAAGEWSVLNEFYFEWAGPDAPPIGYKALCCSMLLDVYEAKHGLSGTAACAQHLGVEYKMTHKPVDDARVQGILFCKLVQHFGISY